MLLSRHEITRLFGDAFASDYSTLSWPPAGAHRVCALHLVFIHECTDGRLPALDEVRQAVQREWPAARRKALNEQFYQHLRACYTVVVEQPQAAGDHIPTGGAVRTVAEAR